MSQSLVERLRKYGTGSPDALLLMREAADGIEALESRLAQQGNAGDQGLPEYSLEIGAASQKYFDSFGHDFRVRTPATFRFHELWDAMRNAATHSVNQQSKEAEQTRIDALFKVANDGLKYGLAEERLATRAADPAQPAASDELPELPPHRYCLNSTPMMEGYTADQMREYARAAIQGAQLSPSKEIQLRNEIAELRACLDLVVDENSTSTPVPQLSPVPVAWLYQHGEFQHFSGGNVCARKWTSTERLEKSRYYDGCTDWQEMPLYAASQPSTSDKTQNQV